MAHIKNPEAYYRAKDSNIKMNASKGRLKKWLAGGEDHQELYDWLAASGEYADVEIVREVLASKFGEGSEDWPLGEKIDRGENHCHWNGEEWVDEWEEALYWVIEKNGTRYVCFNQKARHPNCEKMFHGDFGSFLVKLAQNLIGDHYEYIRNTTGEAVEWWGSLSEKQTEVVRKSLARAKENVDKREERKAEWAAESSSREYVGEVGDKQFEVKGTISYTTSWETDYGITHLTVIRDADDNSIKYKGKRLGSKGDTVEMIATIKAHEVYNDEKQTIVNRPRKIKTQREEELARFNAERDAKLAKEIDHQVEYDDDGKINYLRMIIPKEES